MCDFRTPYTHAAASQMWYAKQVYSHLYYSHVLFSHSNATLCALFTFKCAVKSAARLLNVFKCALFKCALFKCAVFNKRAADFGDVIPGVVYVSVLSGWSLLQCVAACCSVLQCVAVCCSVMQCV